MQLINFSITNYRSIIKAYKLPVSNLTVLIGQNNEGKSNIANALAIAILAISYPSRLRIPHRQRAIDYPEGYDWQRDFPISLQTKDKSGKSSFTLEFSLEESECEELGDYLQSNTINREFSVLSLNITLDKDRKLEFAIQKKDKKNKWKALVPKTASKIATFIGQKITFTYIPAIRTSEAAIKVVQQMVDRELATLESQPEYRASLEAIDQLQKPILDKISAKITQPLQEFIPQVKSVKISVSQEVRFRALRRCEIIIDDGTPTPLERKGDGIKSLAAISLLRRETTQNRLSIVALEEPESHLHPSAIHRLKDVIDELSNNHQVILTTHCPLFVNRINLASNILITNNKAITAKKISEIREILGVRASDNLMHAQIVLVVEGEDDKIILESLFSCYSECLKTSLKNGTLVIDPLHGASNLSYKLSSLKASLCVIHTFLDHDKAGKDAIEEVMKNNLLKIADYKLAICNGMTESEIEDCLNKEIYEEALKLQFGIKLNCSEFKNNNKWSDRLKKTFLSQGKNWNIKMESQVKAIVAEQVNNNPDNSLNLHKRSSIDTLIQALEEKLNK